MAELFGKDRFEFHTAVGRDTGFVRFVARMHGVDVVQNVSPHLTACSRMRAVPTESVRRSDRQKHRYCKNHAPHLTLPPHPRLPWINRKRLSWHCVFWLLHRQHSGLCTLGDSATVREHCGTCANNGLSSLARTEPSIFAKAQIPVKAASCGRFKRREPPDGLAAFRLPQVDGCLNRRSRKSNPQRTVYSRNRALECRRSRGRTRPSQRFLQLVEWT